MKLRLQIAGMAVAALVVFVPLGIAYINSDSLNTNPTGAAIQETACTIPGANVCGAASGASSVQGCDSVAKIVSHNPGGDSPTTGAATSCGTQQGLVNPATKSTR